MRSSVKTPPTRRKSLSASSASIASSSEPGVWGDLAPARLGRQVEEVLLNRLGRLDLVLDAVEAGEQHRRERQIRVAAGVGAAELDALGLGAGRVERDPAGGRPVALGVHQVDRRLVARAPAACRSWWSARRRPSTARACFKRPPTYQRPMSRRPAVAVAEEERLALLPERLVAVHARPVLLEERLGHEGGGVAVRRRRRSSPRTCRASACRPSSPACRTACRSRPGQPVATSWCWTSISIPIFSIVRIISERRSWNLSLGGTGK